MGRGDSAISFPSKSDDNLSIEIDRAESSSLVVLLLFVCYTKKPCLILFRSIMSVGGDIDAAWFFEATLCVMYQVCVWGVYTRRVRVSVRAEMTSSRRSRTRRTQVNFRLLFFPQKRLKRCPQS